jgi:hypothetical protein
MRAILVGALLALGCASTQRVALLEAKVRDLEAHLDKQAAFLDAREAATCQRFSEYQVAHHGRIEFPCVPQDANATLPSVTSQIFGK